MKKRLILPIILAVLLLISIGFNIRLAFFGYDSYLQDPDEIYIMEAGILYNNRVLREGEDITFTYDFDNEAYAALKDSCNLEKTAGGGSELDKALNLMHEFAPRLTHKSDYDNHIDIQALPLLVYSLNNPRHGINCRAKAQILNEMCLALGIYSRKVWINPYSKYDSDCHVVNEVWDSGLEKWVMLDITNDQYWVDENGTPLSILEIRDKGANQEFCTPVCPGEKLSNLEGLKKKHLGEFLYIMKNMVYTYYFDNYTVGEGEDFYFCFPENLNTRLENFVSRESLERSPTAKGKEDDQ